MDTLQGWTSRYIAVMPKIRCFYVCQLKVMAKNCCWTMGVLGAITDQARLERIDGFIVEVSRRSSLPNVSERNREYAKYE